MQNNSVTRDFTTLLIATIAGAITFLASTPLQELVSFIPVKAGITAIGFLSAVAAAAFCLWFGFEKETGTRSAAKNA